MDEGHAVRNIHHIGTDAFPFKNTTYVPSVPQVADGYSRLTNRFNAGGHSVGHPLYLAIYHQHTITRSRLGHHIPVLDLESVHKGVAWLNLAVRFVSSPYR